MNVELKDRIKQAREDAKLKQSELAELIGANQRQISRYEIGKQMPRLETLALIAKATGHSLDWFAGEENRFLSPEAAEAGRLVNERPPADQRFLLGMIQFTITELNLRAARENADRF